MAQNKTTENNSNVAEYLNTITLEDKVKDAFELIKIFEEASTFKAKMWGNAIVGFGSYHYKYDSGREGDAPLTGFSPRKDSFALYLSSQFENREQLLDKLGKHKTGKACVYFKKLSDIDVGILKKIIENSITNIQSMYG